MNWKKMFGIVPMFGFVGDEDEGGTDGVTDSEDVTQSETPAETPTEPATDTDDLGDDEFSGLSEVLQPEQFEKINQMRAMNKRMREKMAKLETEKKEPPRPREAEQPTKPQDESDFDPIKWVSDTDKGKAAIAHLQRSGLDNDQISSLIDLMGITGSRISRHAVDPIASEFREGKFSKALDAFSKDDKFKFGMSKPEIKQAVESYIRNNYDPTAWTSPETIKAAYGLALAEHPELFSAPQKREIVDDGVIHEKSSGNNVKFSGTDSSELKEYADMYNLDLRDPKVRKAAIEGVSAKKKAEKWMD